MEFKSSEELIARVESTLKSFKASGLLDSGDFYRWIKEMLVKLNIPAYNPVHAILKVENYRTQKPEDFFNVWALYRYKAKDTTSSFMEQQQENRFTYFSTTELCCKTDECDVSCDSKMYEENGDIVINKIYLKGETVEQRFSEKSKITIRNFRKYACDGAPSAVGPNEATIDANYIHFDFKEGFVYLQYNGFMIEDGLPMIPDQVQIEEAIENYIIYKFFLEQYYNGTFDVAQRLGEAKANERMSYGVAVSWVKLPSVRSMIDALKRKRKAIGRFQQLHSRG